VVPVIVESALIDALWPAAISALRCWTSSRPSRLPADSPLRGFDQRTAVSPHMAGITADSMRRMGVLAVAADARPARRAAAPRI
jgi:lactate dehydrogenase-like 2-hydroxyacid dehydrogenase